MCPRKLQRDKGEGIEEFELELDGLLALFEDGEITLSRSLKKLITTAPSSHECWLSVGECACLLRCIVIRDIMVI